MSEDHGGNVRLAQLHARTGWSRKELARRVNQGARARGVRLRTDASRVRSWLSGQRPQSPVPELLSELFSEQLGYPITPADIGLPVTDEYEASLRYSESIAATVIAVAELGRYDVRRRGFLRHGSFLAVAAIAPSRDWLLAVLDATEHRPGDRIGEHQVSVIRQAFADFQQADVLHGGGYARHALTEYVTGRVLPMLKNVDPTSGTGPALFAAAAEQTYLLGWTALDDDRHALAQRYLIQALRLAQESGDVALGAHVLAGMSHQALMLAHPREALQLATTGRHGLARAHNAACAARLWAMQASAHAALGDQSGATQAVIESEWAFDTIDGDAGPEWARFIDEPYLAGEWAGAFADVQRPMESIRLARRSIAAAARGHRVRREVFSHVALARAELARRQLDGALRSARRVVDLSTTVRSARCHTAVRDLRSRLSPYRAVSGVREFDDWAHETLTAARPNQSPPTTVG